MHEGWGGDRGPLRSQTMIHQRVVGRRKWPQFLVLLLLLCHWTLNITKQGEADPAEHDKEASKILMLCDLPRAVLRRSEGQSEFKLLLNSSDWVACRLSHRRQSYHRDKCFSKTQHRGAWNDLIGEKECLSIILPKNSKTQFFGKSDNQGYREGKRLKLANCEC